VNASFGHVENVAAPDAQGFTTIPSHAFSNSKNFVLIWERAGTGVQALAMDLVRFSASTFPTSLQVQVFEAGTKTRGIQSKVRKRRAPMARVKCANERDNLAFGELISRLKQAGGLAVAQHDIQGHPGRFLLAPLGNDLLCTVLPVSDIKDLLTRRSGRTTPRAVAQNQPDHSGWENTFAPRMDAMMPPTFPHSGVNRGPLAGQQTGEGGGLVWPLNFGMGGDGSGSGPVDRDGVAMLTPSADLEATEDVDMDA